MLRRKPPGASSSLSLRHTNGAPHRREAGESLVESAGAHYLEAQCDVVPPGLQVVLIS